VNPGVPVVVSGVIWLLAAWATLARQERDWPTVAALLLSGAAIVAAGVLVISNRLMVP